MRRFEKLPFVSVVICAKNEEENLRRNLPKVLSQKYPSFEVILVLDQSTDDSLKLLNDLQMKFSHLKVIEFNKEKTSSGKKEVLEEGIKAAKSNLLIMTDADCYPSSEYWLLGMTNGFADGSNMVLGVGQYEKSKGFVNKLIQYDTLYIVIQYMSHALAGFPFMSVGRNVAYKKDLFDEVGGFENHYDVPSGDDDLLVNEMSRATKMNIVYQPELQTISEAKTSLKSFFDQKSRHISAGLKYNIINKIILGASYCFTTVWYASIVGMICYTGDVALVLTIVLAKKIILFSLFRRIFSKIGVGEIMILTGFMDILSIFIQLLAVFNSLIRNKGKW